MHRAFILPQQYAPIRILAKAKIPRLETYVSVCADNFPEKQIAISLDELTHVGPHKSGYIFDIRRAEINMANRLTTTFAATIAFKTKF
jgi:hypothetical protein